MFTPRPRGVTLRRLERAVYEPHGSKERFDPEFPVAMRCSRCGQMGHGPRSQMQAALREHMESECPARHTNKGGDPIVTRILYPRL